WNKTFNADHRLNAIAGFTTQGRTNDPYGFGASQLPNEQLGLSGLDEGLFDQKWASESEFTLASLLARVNYNYRSKYLLIASIRADGSSKFSKGNRWGYFPSAAFAWRMSEEPFMKSLGFVSDAKLRVSYG